MSDQLAYFVLACGVAVMGLALAYSVAWLTDKAVRRYRWRQARRAQGRALRVIGL